MATHRSVALRPPARKKIIPTKPPRKVREPDAITYGMAATLIDRIEKLERRVATLEDNRI